jgi:hypothetical protein
VRGRMLRFIESEPRTASACGTKYLAGIIRIWRITQIDSHSVGMRSARRVNLGDCACRGHSQSQTGPRLDAIQKSINSR